MVWINAETSIKKKNQWIFPDFTENKKCNLDNYNPGYSIHLGLHIYIFLYLAKSLMISFDFVTSENFRLTGDEILFIHHLSGSSKDFQRSVKSFIFMH